MAKVKQRSKLTVRVLRSILLDVEDELVDVTSALGCLGELRSMAAVMGDIVDPPSADRIPRSADRIARCARRHLGKHFGKYFDDGRLKQASRLEESSTATDLTEAAELLTLAAQERLLRLQALLRLMREQQR